MATLGETLALAVMALFGVATAGVLAYALRDMVAQVAGEGADPAAAQRVALVGPGVYLLGFLVVLAGTLLALPSVAGVAVVDLGIGIILLASVPMALGFYRAWQA